MSDYDLAIIGAGIGGAGLAYALLSRAPGLKLLLLEAESQPGYHTTGRSAAFYAETYGGPGIQPLTSASRAFLAHPPADFSDSGFLGARGALYLAPPGHPDLLDRAEAEFANGRIPYRRVGPTEILEMAPRLRTEWATAAIYEPGCADIDVAALHQAYLRAVRRSGAMLQTDARVEALSRNATGWNIHTPAGSFSATRLVNAAGAWGDEVAKLAGIRPVGLVPMRRTIVVAEVDPPAGPQLPLVMDAGNELYFRVDSGRLWISPHDETPDVPHDVQPDELDIAIALDRFEKCCDWPVKKIVSRWAGLRSFAPDRLPVLGPDPADPGFFWCVGQGGWGIQTSPAMSAVLAALILEEPPFLDATLYRPARFG
ncbi:MAG: FAD-binding oxidoreductase [Sphingomonadaceae bacterium]